MTKFSPTPHIYGHTHIYIGKHCWSLWLWNINAMDLIVQFYPWQCESKLTIFFSAGGRRWTWCLGLIVIHMINDFEECPSQEQSCGMKSTVLVVRLGTITNAFGAWQTSCSYVQTHPPSTTKCKSIGIEACKPSAPHVLLLWNSPAKLLPSRWAPCGSL